MSAAAAEAVRCTAPVVAPGRRAGLQAARRAVVGERCGGGVESGQGIGDDSVGGQSVALDAGGLGVVLPIEGGWVIPGAGEARGMPTA